MLETSLWKLVRVSKERLTKDYYQSMREHQLLREAMANLHTDALEQWHLERNDDAQLSGLAD